MIIARSPLRISLGGGSTDLPSYYREHEGFLIAAAINKYVYVSVMKPFSRGIFLKYSEFEQVASVEEIKHPLFRQVLQLPLLTSNQIELISFADIPAGTGLGSSGSFTTALLTALYAYNSKSLLPQELAELAAEIEMHHLNEPVGKQDQYIAAFGGLTCFTFHKNNEVTIKPLTIPKEMLLKLENNLLLFFTGYSRNASYILQEQKDKTLQENSEMLDNLHFIKQLGYDIKQALEQADESRFANLLHQHWEHKKQRSNNMSNAHINSLYEFGLKNGALGGKLVGAGGGGFLMFYAHDRDKLRQAMQQKGLEELYFNFEYTGTKVVTS